MQLRDHPIFGALGYGIHWWPPAWVRVGYDTGSIHGEVGTLVEAKCHERLSKRLFLKMRHQGGLYMGVVVVNDVGLSLQLCTLLQKHIGRTIREIGDLDIDFLR